MAATLMHRAWRRAQDTPRWLLIMAVRGYRLFFKAWLGNRCRFEPSCSAYALTALQRFGAAQGSLITGQRLLRCHPWCAGGHDPVPQHKAGLFSRLGLTRADSEPTSTRNPT